MDKSNNIAYLVAHYQSTLNPKTKKQVPKTPASKFTPFMTSRHRKLNNQSTDTFNSFALEEIETLASMSYLHKITERKPLGIVINPASRFKNCNNDRTGLKFRIRQKVTVATRSDFLIKHKFENRTIQLSDITNIDKNKKFTYINKMQLNSESTSIDKSSKFGNRRKQGRVFKIEFNG